MKFADVLRELLAISNIKLKDLAASLNYDNSYISKWVNDHHLPNLNLEKNLIPNLSSMISREIYRLGTQDQLLKFTERNLPVYSYPFVRYFVYSLLEDSYYQSYFEKNQTSRVLEGNHVYIGFENILNKAAELIQKASLQSKIQLNIYSNVELTDLIFSQDRIRYLFYTTLDLEINYHHLLSEDTVIPNEKLVFFINEWVHRALSVNINIYRANKNLKDRIVYVEGAFALFFETDENNTPIVMTYVTDPYVLANLGNRMRQTYKDARLLMGSGMDNLAEFSAFSSGIATGNQFMFYLSYLDGFFLEEDFLKTFLTKRKVSELTVQLDLQTAAIGRIVAEEFPVTVVVDRDLINHALLNREIVIGQSMYKANKSEMREFIRRIIDLIKINPNLRIFLRSDNMMSLKLASTTSSMFCDENNILFKKNPCYVDRFNKSFFQIFSRPLNTSFFNLLREELLHEDVVELDSEELVSKLQHYMKIL